MTMRGDKKCVFLYTFEIRIKYRTVIFTSIKERIYKINPSSTIIKLLSVLYRFSYLYLKN